MSISMCNHEICIFCLRYYGLLFRDKRWNWQRDTFFKISSRLGSAKLKSFIRQTTDTSPGSIDPSDAVALPHEFCLLWHSLMTCVQARYFYALIRGSVSQIRTLHTGSKKPQGPIHAVDRSACRL